MNIGIDAGSRCDPVAYLIENLVYNSFVACLRYELTLLDLAIFVDHSDTHPDLLVLAAYNRVYVLEFDSIELKVRLAYISLTHLVPSAVTS